MADCNLDKKCDTQHELEKFTSLHEQKIENIESSIVRIENNMSKMEEATRQMVKIVAVYETVQSGIHNINIEIIEFRKQWQTDKTAIHSKIHSVAEEIKRTHEVKYANLEAYVRTELREIRKEQDLKNTEFITIKWAGFMTTIIGLLMGGITFIVSNFIKTP